jgi:two-component system sensor histidine kinase PilS (NtrC family)
LQWGYFHRIGLSLIFITVAASSIFLRGQIATLLAALACIAILAESVISGYLSRVDINPLAVALLGLLLFVTSLLFQYLTRRILASQQSAAEQAAQAATLQKLNELIVQRMHTGIAVVDNTDRILLYNEAAARLLYLPVQFDVRDQVES